MIKLVFEGPYSFLKSEGRPYIADLPENKGIYIWTVPQKEGTFKTKELVYYVGLTTRPFQKRMTEHLKGYLSSEYGINDPSALQKGARELVWDGLWREAKIEDFIQNRAQLFPKLDELLKIYKIYVAPLDCESRLLERIEAAIATCLYKQSGIAGNFQEPEIHYNNRTEDEEPIVVALQSSKMIIGLPQSLET